MIYRSGYYFNWSFVDRSVDQPGTNKNRSLVTAKICDNKAPAEWLGICLNIGYSSSITVTDHGFLTSSSEPYFRETFHPGTHTYLPTYLPIYLPTVSYDRYLESYSFFPPSLFIYFFFGVFFFFSTFRLLLLLLLWMNYAHLLRLKEQFTRNERGFTGGPTDRPTEHLFIGIHFEL